MNTSSVIAADQVDDSVSSDAEGAAAAPIDEVSAANPSAESVAAESASVESFSGARILVDRASAEEGASVERASAASVLVDRASVEGASDDDAPAGDPRAANPDELSRDSASSTAQAEVSDVVDISRRWWRRWLPRPVTGILMLLVVVSVVLAAVFGWKLETRNDRQAAGAAALAAAQDYAVALTSIDSSHIDSDFATVLNGATGEFEHMYSQSAEQLKPMLVQAKSVSKGHVVAASVQSASDNQAVIMLFVDIEITNVTNPTPRVDRNRVLMTVDRVDGRWLTSKVELP
ncbi:hypothetical protein [Nocardia sp. NPDC052112]|uniref:hypothetical protein n=1 Tax=Nocardia sp. NPDC052112 TaxID=3155646 RepID=UPI00343FA029